MGVNELLAVIVIAAYNLAILAGCAFLVWHGWSGWWFMLALACLKVIRTGKAAEGDD